MNRQGVGSHAGLLLYSTPLAKPVGGEIYLEDPKFFGKSKFKGDPASERLNGNGDLIKLANELAKTPAPDQDGLQRRRQRARILPTRPDGRSNTIRAVMSDK